VLAFVLAALDPAAEKASRTRVARRNVFMGEGLLQKVLFWNFGALIYSGTRLHEMPIFVK
jgi:hypothetical protein